MSIPIDPDAIDVEDIELDIAGALPALETQVRQLVKRVVAGFMADDRVSLDVQYRENVPYVVVYFDMGNADIPVYAQPLSTLQEIDSDPRSQG